MTGGVSRAANKLVDTNLDRGWGVIVGERSIFCANSSNRNDVGLLTVQKGVWGSRIVVWENSQGVGFVLSQMLSVCQALIDKYNKEILDNRLHMTTMYYMDSDWRYSYTTRKGNTT